MNEDKLNPTGNTKEKSVVAKIITVLGLIGILLFLTWSSVQVVRLFPEAITSLASLADSVYTYKENMGDKQENLTLNSDSNMINSGDDLVVWWENKNKSGSYSFKYTCSDGLNIDIKAGDKDFTDINCENNYDLGLVDRIVLKIDSNSKDFLVMDYSIAYYKDNNEVAISSTTKNISIVNQKLVANTNNSETNTNTTNSTTTSTSTTATSTEITTSDTKAGIGESKGSSTATTSEKIKDNVVVKKDDQKKNTQENKTPSFKQTYTYSIPVSKPDGFTDLLLNNLDIGYINQSNIFVKSNLINKNESNAIQFIIHNIGNKTSDNWLFEIKTTEGFNFISEKQLPLKPNERAIMTVSFPVVKNVDSQKISVLIKTNSDKNKSNNYLERTLVATQ